MNEHQEKLFKLIAEMERERVKKRVQEYTRVGRKEQLYTDQQLNLLRKLNSLYSTGIITDEEYKKGLERIEGIANA